MVWPASAAPLLFDWTPDDAYTVSHHDLPRPGDDASLFAQPLPEGATMVSILTDTQQFVHVCPDSEDRTYPRAQVQVWQLREDTLQNTLAALSCDLPTRETLFSADATALHVWMQPEVEFGDFFFSRASYAYPAEYVWDSAQHTFIAPEPVRWTMEAACETYPDPCPDRGTMGGHSPGVSL